MCESNARAKKIRSEYSILETRCVHADMLTTTTTTHSESYVFFAPGYTALVFFFSFYVFVAFAKTQPSTIPARMQRNGTDVDVDVSHRTTLSSRTDSFGGG